METHQVQGERGAVRFGMMPWHLELAVFSLDHGTVVGPEFVGGYRDAGDCRRCPKQGDCKKNAAHDAFRLPGALTLDHLLPALTRLPGELLAEYGQRRVLQKPEPGAMVI